MTFRRRQASNAYMKHLAALALVVAGVALPLCAQRGGGHGGGGFSGHSSGGSAFHGGASPAFRGGSAPAFHGSSAPAFRGSFAASPGRYRSVAGSRPLGFSSAAHTQRPNFYSRRPGYDARFRNGRFYSPYYGAGIPYGTGWVDPDFLDYPDTGDYDASGAPPDDTINGYAPQGPDQGPPPPYLEQSYAAPQPALPMAAPESPAATPENEDTVTLVFKDGRPAEQIHNYALTRTTLYVRDGHRRDIPVDQLDLAATEKVNHDAGIDFHIPGATP